MSMYHDHNLPHHVSVQTRDVDLTYRPALPLRSVMRAIGRFGNRQASIPPANRCDATIHNQTMVYSAKCLSQA